MDTSFNLTFGDMDIAVFFVGIYPHNMLFPSRLHEHLNFEVHSALTGQLTYTTETSSYILNGTSLLVIPPHILHQSSVDSENTLLLSFEFSISKRKKCTESVYNKCTEIIRNNLCSPRFIRSAASEVNELRKLVLADHLHTSPLETISDSIIKWYISIIISKMLFELLRDGHLQMSEEAPKISHPENISPRIAYISQYIFANYNGAPCVRELANLMHLSTRQIERIIKEEMHSSFSELLNQYRIKLATHIIRTNLGKSPPPSFSKVAASVGFESYYTFLKQFKIYTGTTPSEYLENMLSQKSIAIR